MAGIGSTTAAMPSAATSTGLSAAALGRLQGAGLDADVIDIASRAVGTGTAAPPARGTSAPSAPAPAPPGAQAAVASLPSAAPGAFAVSPTPLDGSSADYPTLTTSHVAVLRAVGTPDAILQQIAAKRPNAGWLDQYIQGEVMQNPEGWDAYVGNPAGTARAGLQQLLPGVQLPAPGQGNPGYTMDGNAVPASGGIVQTALGNVPGLTQPIVAPGADPSAGANSVMKTVVWGIAAVGVGLLAMKFFKGRGGAKGAADGAAAAAKAAEQAFGAGGAAGGGAAEMSKLMLEHAKLGGLSTRQALVVGAMASGGGASLGAEAGMAPEVLDHVLRGFAPTSRSLAQVINASATGQVPTETTMAFHLLDKALDTHQIDSLAYAFHAMKDNAGAAAAVAGQQTAGMQQVLAGLQKILPV